MSNRYHEPWARENFHFHRTDPTPWVEIEEPVKETSKFIEAVKVIGACVAIALLVGYASSVKADVLAYTPNTAGGKIAITDSKCTSGSGHVAYSTNPKGETLFGCWVHDNTFIHILWSGSTSPNSYDLVDWTVAKKNSPTM